MFGVTWLSSGTSVDACQNAHQHVLQGRTSHCTMIAKDGERNGPLSTTRSDDDDDDDDDDDEMGGGYGSNKGSLRLEKLYYSMCF